MKTKTLILFATLFILFSCKKELIEQPKNYECKVYTVQTKTDSILNINTFYRYMTIQEKLKLEHDSTFKINPDFSESNIENFELLYTEKYCSCNIIK